MWSSISWPSRNVCFEVSKRGEQTYRLWMFLWHVIFDQLTASQRLLRSEQKRWTDLSFMNVPLPCDLRSADRVATFASKWAKEVKRSIVDECSFAMWSSISWPSRNVCFEVSKRGEQKYLVDECSFPMWSSISWPSRNVCFEVSKRGEQKSYE